MSVYKNLSGSPGDECKFKAHPRPNSLAQHKHLSPNGISLSATMHSYVIMSLLFGAVYSLQPLGVEESASKMISLYVKRHPIARPFNDSPHFLRRATPTPSLLHSKSGNMYIIEVDVGTPPQPVALQLDTGSSDLWVSQLLHSSLFHLAL